MMKLHLCKFTGVTNGLYNSSSCNKSPLREIILLLLIIQFKNIINYSYGRTPVIWIYWGTNMIGVQILPSIIHIIEIQIRIEQGVDLIWYWLKFNSNIWNSTSRIWIDNTFTVQSLDVLQFAVNEYDLFNYVSCRLTFLFV